MISDICSSNSLIQNHCLKVYLQIITAKKIKGTGRTYIDRKLRVVCDHLQEDMPKDKKRTLSGKEAESRNQSKQLSHSLTHYRKITGSPISYRPA